MNVIFGNTFYHTERHNQLTTISMMLPIIPIGTIAYPFALLKVNHCRHHCRYTNLNSHLYISSPTLQHLDRNPTTQQQQIV